MITWSEPLLGRLGSLSQRIIWFGAHRDGVDHRDEARRAAANPVLDAGDARHAVGTPGRRSPGALLQRLAEREVVVGEESPEPEPSAVGDSPLDVPSERVGLAQTWTTRSIETYFGLRDVRLVSGHAISVQQLDQLLALFERGLFARTRFGRGEDGEPAPGPSEDGAGSLDPGEGLRGGLVVLGEDGPVLDGAERLGCQAADGLERLGIGAAGGRQRIGDADALPPLWGRTDRWT